MTMKTFTFTGVLATTICLAATLVASAEQVSIKGSNTFGEKLAPMLIEAFQSKHTNWTISMESTDSGSGIHALLDQACDIAASSRGLNEDEYRLIKARGLKLTTHAIAYYGIAVIVNADNKIKNLADHQVRDIFTGSISDWSAVGGSAGAIELHIASRKAGTYLGFQELAMERKPYGKSAVEHASYAEIAEAVANNPNAIGFVAMSNADAPGTRSISINGVVPNPVTLADNQYPYARLLRLFTIRGKDAPAAMTFIRFIRSAKGQSVAEEAGFVRRFQKHLSPAAELP